MILEPQKNTHWDIFCDVVDNYGDIGVTWRLAKALVAEYQIQINLWINDLSSFKVILPEVNFVNVQTIDGVKIINWTQPLSTKWLAGEALIEAFACKIPQSIIEELGKQKELGFSKPPKWINLEYLTAESWIDDCHLLHSIQENGVARYCFFPGFTEKSGGLIIEKNLFTRRDIWQDDKQNKIKLFKNLGINANDNDFFISYFSYSTSFLKKIAKLNIKSKINFQIIIPTKNKSNLHDKPHAKENIKLHYIDFTKQDNYDELLWSCDLNIVRGEDSFVRAQWADKPFLWHIYPQDDLAHIVKLNSFMQLYKNKYIINNFDYKGLETIESMKVWENLNLILNEQLESNLLEKTWLEFIKNKAELDKIAKKWTKNWENASLNAIDLQSRLVKFVKNV